MYTATGYRTSGGPDIRYNTVRGFYPKVDISLKNHLVVKLLSYLEMSKMVVYGHWVVLDTAINH